MPGSRREYLDPMKEGTEFTFLTNVISIIAHRGTELIDARSKIVGDFIAAHSTPVALREGVLYVRVLQPALHYELEQISRPEILRKLKIALTAKSFATSAFALADLEDERQATL
jgi:hypothetical protein